MPKPRPNLSGEGWPARRRAMVRTQIVKRGVDDPRVLAAMERVPREEFVPREEIDQACDDCPLPISCDQTISQPFTVAYMAAALNLRGTERVLEIGTGCGYGAAVLAELAAEVHTIERWPQLAHDARSRLKRLGYQNVHVHLGDGAQGLSEFAPYDAICVTAGAETLPPAYQRQLSLGGRLVIPIGDPGQGRQMLKYTRRQDYFDLENLGNFAFVPLIGEG